MRERLHVFGSVDKEGKVELPKSFRSDVVRMFKGRKISVVVTVDNDFDTTGWRRFYFAIVVPHVIAGFVAEGHAFSPANQEDVLTVHRYLKHRYLGWTSRELFQGYKTEPTTTRLTDGEWRDYIGAIRAWAMEFFGISIPEKERVIKNPGASPGA